MKNKLGKLKQVDLRTGWRHEAHDFTNWLAESTNLQLLSDEIGLDLTLIQTEAKVGGFNVDILAEDSQDGHKVIIENQLETTNHDHLGKLITYASGYDARTIIWVVKSAREEHRQAIDWLNENTSDELGFYLLKIELWQIGDSDPAPKFEVISRPNSWARTLKGSAGSAELTETKIKQLEFWEAFKEYARSAGTSLRFQKSRPQHWTTISVGSSLCHLSLTINSREGLLGCELYIPDSQELYEHLIKHQASIEEKAPYPLEWMALPNKKASRIKTSTAFNFDQEADWETGFEWLLGAAECFRKAFPQFIQKL